MTSDNCITIPLTQGYEAIVDERDADLANHKWYVLTNKHSNVYAARETFPNGKRTTLLMHRVIMERSLGASLEKAIEVDHENNNGLDNRRDNLRTATRAQNSHNSKKPRHNTSGYKGVSLYKPNNKWRAYINLNRKRIYLGYFDTPLEAYKAYCKAAEQYHGEFARLE